MLARRILTCLTVLVLLGGLRTASALPIPVVRSGTLWMPARAEAIAISSLRLEIYPARDPETEAVVWWIDESLVIRNYGPDPVELHLAVPNAWSEQDASVSGVGHDFWVEAHVNGRALPTELTRLVANPGLPAVGYRFARRFTVHLDSTESAHVRVLFALPLERSDDAEYRLSYPFHIRSLYDGAIEAGVIVLRWSEQIYGFRANLPAYARYRDRVEWFLRGFEPTEDLEVRFLARASVFQMVAESIGCPMPWELVDRVADGDPSSLRRMLSAYRDDQLDLCGDLPAALRGSAAAARRAGLIDLDLSQFTPQGSDLEGPLIVPDPTFSPDRLSESEQLYGRFLRQELERRAGE